MNSPINQKQQKCVSAEKKKKKILFERKGDWICPNCRNLNFAFRKECNRCKCILSELCLDFSSDDFQMQGGMNISPTPNTFNLLSFNGIINLNSMRENR